MYVLFLSQIYAPSGSFYERVIDGCARAQIAGHISVDSQRRVAAAFAAAMTLPRLPVIVGLSLAFVSQVGDCVEKDEGKNVVVCI